MIGKRKKFHSPDLMGNKEHGTTDCQNPRSLSFFQQVYEVARLIPFGRVTSYGAIAGYLGTRGSARMVGWAMNSLHSEENEVPAHRVVNRNGILTGKHHFGGPHVMRQLLENEGIKIDHDHIEEFDEIFWDPVKELQPEVFTIIKDQEAGRVAKKSKPKLKITDLRR